MGFLGRVNNPRFMEQVSSAYGLEDRIVVVMFPLLFSIFVGSFKMSRSSAYTLEWNLSNDGGSIDLTGMPERSPITVGRHRHA